jgi:hypothetical protein
MIMLTTRMMSRTNSGRALELAMRDATLSDGHPVFTVPTTFDANAPTMDDPGVLEVDTKLLQQQQLLVH